MSKEKLSLFGNNNKENKQPTRTDEFKSKLEIIHSDINDRTGLPIKSGVNFYLHSNRENRTCDMCSETKLGKTYYYESGYSDTRLIICNDCKRRESFDDWF